MAKQTEIGYEASKEWKDFQTGGTRIDAADLNHMEQGISDACNAVDELRTKRLVTYMVAQDGDTATQDLYQEPILGPCLILDLAERATYYDTGEDGEQHERVLITSGAQIDADREYISQTQSGNVLFDTDPQSVTSHDVVFDQAFSSNPSICVTLQSNFPQNFSAGVADVSKTGFRINVHNASSTLGNTRVYWIATALRK